MLPTTNRLKKTLKLRAESSNISLSNQTTDVSWTKLPTSLDKMEFYSLIWFYRTEIFFNFFKHPEVLKCSKDIDEDVNEELQYQFEYDYAIGTCSIFVMKAS
ncbi:hypothetical protein TSUD_351010 [Trifolium subterraneum]|uniref:Uncharacterized protein n=1 Tax=Trifolium subterraneum TaxID=3900 RepID=A0A2Z6PEB0_TRISU|nr:hypothetical protein TSUD_351010 [Trifolium subterraneum]